MEASSNYVLAYPNRERGESKATKLAVVVLLLVTAALTAVVCIAGAPALPMFGVQLFAYGYVILLLVMAYYVSRWSRGVLAMASALAVIFLALDVVAAQGWFARDQTGFDEPLLPAAVLGVVTLMLVPVQLLLVAFAMRGFNQAWNIEVEVPEEEAREGVADKFDEGGRRIKHADGSDVEE